MLEYQAQKSYWDGIEERRSPDHPAVRAFSRPKIEIVLTELGRARTMLEVGAGNGYFSSELMSYFDLTALDFSRNMLRRNPVPAQSKVQGDAERLPFDDESFDIVLCANLLHHLVVPAAAVREMARVTRRHVVLIEPNALNPAMLLFGVLNKEERGAIKFLPSYLKDLGVECNMRLRRFVTQGAVVPNRTPPALLPVLRVFDRPQPLGFYNIAIFDVKF